MITRGTVQAVRSLEQVVEEVRAAFCHQVLMSWVVGGGGKTMEHDFCYGDLSPGMRPRLIDPKS